MTAPAIRRFNQDVKRLNASKAELKRDQKDLKTDRGELKRDQTALTGLQTDRTNQLAAVQAQIDALDPNDPDFAAKLTALQQQQQGIKDSFDPQITSKKNEITHDSGVITHDHKELKADNKLIKKRLKRARKDLQPAELRANTLKGTNRMRHAVGLKRVGHLIGNTKTVAGCARLLLASKNVSFWSGLSSGSDRANVVRLAHWKDSRVFASNTSIRHTMPKLKLMQALVAMSRHGHIQINALTGGTHSVGSNHYIGHAVDLAVINTNMVVSIARRFGGFRNSETDHIHLDFP